MKPTFFWESEEKKKRTWFMSLWRTWRKQEGKKGGFSSASFETRQVALLNKQGLHKYTDNNLKLHKQISIPLAESRKACLETTPAALIALVLQSLLLSCQHTSPKAGWGDFRQKKKASVFLPATSCTNNSPLLTQRISAPVNDNEFTRAKARICCFALKSFLSFID